MNEERVVKTVNYLLAFASICLFYGITYYVTDEHYEYCKDRQSLKVEYKSQPVYHRPRIKNPVLEAFYNTTTPVYETVTVIETEYLGEYFVTAYASAELGGSTATASGVECEYHEEWYIPTTAAIDPRLHSFGEYLMIEGKVYRCDDTGGNVKGRWVDCYVPDMDSVRSWDTGWKSVYQVTFTEKRIKTGEVTLYEFTKHHFLRRSISCRTDHRDDCRNDDRCTDHP